MMFSDNLERLQDSQQMTGLWSAPVMQAHPQLHPHLQHQQLQQQLLLGGHGNMGPLVGQQLSQLLGPGQQQSTMASPPGLGPLNMMIGAPGPGQHVSMGPMFPVQSPPASSGQFLQLANTGQPRQENVVTPNSTPGLQTPTPSATPPIINIDSRPENNVFHNNRIVPGQDFEPVGDMDHMMGWRGLQALQGGTIADMFGVDRQFGMMERQNGMERHPGPGFPGALPVSGYNNFSVAMAHQAQENMIRLQQLQQQNPEFLNKQHQHHQLAHQFPGHQQELARQFAGLPPPQCQSPSPPGPRPRPLGGDSSPPGFSHDSLPVHLGEETSKPVEHPLVIGSWNEECEKDEVVLPPLTMAPPNMSQPPPPRLEWGGTFSLPRHGPPGHWGGQPGDHRKHEQAGSDNFRGKRGGGGRGGGGRGARGGRGGGGGGGYGGKPGVDHTREKAQGKNAAIEETKAMLAKMRLEDKELMTKNKKEKVPGDSPETDKPVAVVQPVPVVQPGAYRPRDRRGRDDRKDGDRGRGGRGRGRGGGGGGVGGGGGGPPPGNMKNMMMRPFVPGDFRTPPFPGMDGFMPPVAFGQFPPHMQVGFPRGMFPMGLPADMRGRGGFNRGRGFPMGFPPRGFPPPMMGYRGDRGGRGRGRGGHGQGQQRNKKEQGKLDSEENTMMNAIYVNEEEIIKPASEEEETPVSVPEEEIKTEEIEKESADDV